MEEYGFYAMLDRMQYIIRWGMMRNSRKENIKEQSFDVAVIAHALCLIHNRLDPSTPVDEYKVMAYAIYHDCTEIITGDLPTPIKYHNREITKAYKEVEQEAAESLVSLLPEDEGLRDEYLELLAPSMDTPEKEFMHRLVKAADKIAAYIKCVREESSGSVEFKAAKESTAKAISNMSLPEADYFMEHYAPPYGYTLDKLTSGDL